MNLSTPRCELRPITAVDAQRLHEVWTSPGVRRYLWDDEIIPLEQTRAAIETSQQLFRDHGYGLWGAWPTASTELAGFTGLWPFRDPPELELLYGVAEPWWGQGYAVEIAQGVLAYCTDSLRMPIVRASTDTANVASVRVLEKLGFVRMRQSTVAGLDTVFFERLLQSL
jgi:ribosomal-protein-alanine N-acetyltransferase